MSFFRHREIFRSDVIRSVRERRNRRSPAHRLDEFPVGYSSPSCTPALLASASPTGIHSATQARRRQRSFQPTANCVLTFCATPGDNRNLSCSFCATSRRDTTALVCVSVYAATVQPTYGGGCITLTIGTKSILTCARRYSIHRLTTAVADCRKPLNPRCPVSRTFALSTRTHQLYWRLPSCP